MNAVLVFVLAAVAQLEPVPEAWKEVREAPEHVRHLEADVKCGDCHAGTFAPEAVLPCDGCHHETVEPLHLFGKTNNPACVACHDFRNDASVTPWSCANCHIGEATQKVSAPEVIAHATQSCDTCHIAHGPTPEVTCTNCHTKHSGDRESHACNDCHLGHEPKQSANNRCATCHGTNSLYITETQKIPVTALFELGHEKCNDCHVPHETKPKSCKTCHEQVSTKGHAKNEDCAGCHLAHDVAPVKAQDSCASCHKDVHRDQNHASCVSCHAPHADKKAPPVVKACTTCHEEAKRDDLLHAAGKVSCSRCHLPHAFSEVPEGNSSCASCHKVQVALVAKDHRDCWQCHENAAHAATDPPKECATCHVDQASTAPEGHDECEKCHEPHGGRQKEEAACSTCHLDQVRSIHGDTEQGCQSCHRPHGPDGLAKPPACATCHTSDSVTGLHTSGGHSKCSDCHQSHETEPPRTRDDCLSCHGELRDHYPKASVCSSCHPFSATQPNGTGGR